MKNTCKDCYVELIVSKKIGNRFYYHKRCDKCRGEEIERIKKIKKYYDVD